MGLFNVYSKFNISITKAKGVYLYDDKNKKYLDLYGGHGVISIGHSHPTFTNKIKVQLDKIGFYSNSIQIPIQQKLANKLTKQSGYPNHNLFLCNSGAEANENAIKIASFHTKRKKVIAFKGSFHGRTAANLNITDNSSISAPINLNNFPVDFIELNSESSLINCLKNKDVCAVIIEGIQGVGGLDYPSIDYLKCLKKNTEKYGTLLILDEIQSGYGRTGKFFAHQYADIEADIVTMAKGMGNGFPVGGVLIHSKIRAIKGILGSTFGGNHLACSAAIAVLDTLENKKILENVLQISAFLRTELSSLSKVKNLKGKGLMLGLEFDYSIQEIRSKLVYDYHIFCGNSANPNVLRILPPLNISKKQIQPFISSLKEILT